MRPILLCVAAVTTFSACGEPEGPVYETRPGWSEDVRACRRFEDLPQNARDYVEWVESVVDVPLEILSVGPGRDETIARAQAFRPR